MTKITGIVRQFKNMFKMIMCGDKYPLFTQVILEINQNEISINCMDSTRAVGTGQKYTGFNIEGSADIPIDTVSIYEALKLFDDNDPLMFNYDDNKIILSVNTDSKKDIITIPVPDNDEIGNKSVIVFNEDSITVNGNEMKFDACVKVDASYIQNQIRKANFVDALYHEYSIDMDDGKLILSVGNKDNFEISTSTEIIVKGKGTAASKYMHGYDDIFKALSGNIIIQINNDRPMIITKTENNYSVKYLIAPVISE